jgi:hypothetical protein
MVVVDQVFMGKGGPEHRLHHQRSDIMLNQVGRRRSRKQAAKRSISPIAQSVSPSSSAPASEVIDPPSKAGTEGRRHGGLPVDGPTRS